MSKILYIHIKVEWSLSGIMTSKLVIRESESPRAAASSILISWMTRPSVIIPYGIDDKSNIYSHFNHVTILVTIACVQCIPFVHQIKILQYLSIRKYSMNPNKQ